MRDELCCNSLQQMFNRFALTLTHALRWSCQWSINGSMTLCFISCFNQTLRHSNVLPWSLIGRFLQGFENHVIYLHEVGTLGSPPIWWSNVVFLAAAQRSHAHSENGTINIVFNRCRFVKFHTEVQKYPMHTVDKFDAVLLQFYSVIYLPKIIKIVRVLTKLLRK